MTGTIPHSQIGNMMPNKPNNITATKRFCGTHLAILSLGTKTSIVPERIAPISMNGIASSRIAAKNVAKVVIQGVIPPLEMVWRRAYPTASGKKRWILTITLLRSRVNLHYKNNTRIQTRLYPYKEKRKTEQILRGQDNGGALVEPADVGAGDVISVGVMISAISTGSGHNEKAGEKVAGPVSLAIRSHAAQ